MDNKPAQKIHGGISLLSPPDLSPKQIELSNKLNDFYQKNNFKPLRPKPSEIFIGAIYGMQDPLRSNPDWIAQVANSLRELLYPIWYEVRRKPNKPMEITNKFKRFGYEFIEDVFSEIEEVYGKLNDLAHHGLEPKKFTEVELNNFSDNDFEKLVSRFENLMFQAFTLPIRQIMNQIDQLVSKTPAEQEDQKALEQEVRSLIREKSAKEYFYYKAHERWLDWLWQNGFLDVIKEKAEDLTGYGYRIPELKYLVRMAEKAPVKVVNIMLAVPISSETFNPEVIDRFSYICSTLPEDQLARMVQKIRDERWIPLMDAFEHWGANCEDMFKTLDDAKDYESLLVLAEAVLSVRIKDESEKAHSGSLADTPFYFNYLSYVKVFEYLLNVDDEYTEQALELAIKVMADIITLSNKKLVLSDQEQLLQLAEQAFGDEEESEKVFKVDDRLLLYDVDFFDLEPGQEDCLSSEDDTRELAAAIKVLTQKLIGDRCDKPEAIRDVYIRYVGDFDNPDAKLPDSPTMWRLRLFVLSLYPEAFKDELKKAFFRLFEVEQYDEITRGTEYKKALQKGFAALSEKDKRHYVKRVMKYFTQQGRDRTAEEKNWHICSGSRILSMITNQLTEEEKGQAEEAGFTLDPNYQPEPSIGTLQVGRVAPRGPITEKEFGQLSIAQIAEKLRHEWKPDNLTQQNTSDDFLNPRNADGVSESLKSDMPNRLQEYIQNAAIFFERGVLDEHYTYTFLWGIQETIWAHGEIASEVHWDGLLDLCMAIKTSGERNSFERDKKDRNAFDPWLAGWDAVHFAMTGIAQALLTEKNGLVPIDFGEYRDRIFSIVRYLLSHPDPSPEDEQNETAKCEVKSPAQRDFEEGFYDTESVPENDAGCQVSDPRHMAVSAVRGQAFKTFALFIYQDDKKFRNEDTVKIADDVKELYESVLEKETTRALMFMFGHSLPFYYSRDRDWIGSLLPQIFPQEPAKKYLYTAAWEGYLSNNLFANNLYEEMFCDPEIQKLYERGLALTDVDYPPQQEHFKKPDEGIAEHLAFALIHYENLGFDHPLFKAFWKENNPERHANFVNFLGRSYVSGNNANNLFQQNPESKKRLKVFWDWLLEHYENPKPFIKFDYWINLENETFEPAWLAKRVKQTLKKTEGALDSDFKLTKSIVRLAQANPEDTLKIAQWYLLEGCVRCNEPRRFSYVNVENEWKEAFKILHGNSETKSETSALINKLIQEGGKPFWNLKEILDKNGKSPT